MRRVLNTNRFTIKIDNNFPAVINACATIRRDGQNGTWITNDMIAAYCELNRLGWAHSAEAYDTDGNLAGGCYGLLIGRVFFGESMFAYKPNASKAAFLTYATNLFNNGIRMIDCQVPSQHLRSLGGHEVSRKTFLSILSLYVNPVGVPQGEAKN
jgi:leucyl/phenylalanyl-tRNA--protein transferase